MQSSTSGSPESFNFSSSVEGLVGGIEGNSGSRASSSSHSTPRAPKKGNLKKSGKRFHQHKVRGYPSLGPRVKVGQEFLGGK